MPTIAIGEQEIYYTVQGSGDTLLIFPDNIHASGAYAGEIDYFSKRFRVLSFDYPATGRSSRDLKYQDEREFDLWNYRADLACHLLQLLDVRASIVIGAGHGAWAALHFAGRQAKLHNLAVNGVIADSFLASLDSRTLHRALDTREHYYVRRADWLREQHGDDWRDVVDADTLFLRRIADRGGYEVPDFVLNSIPCPVLLSGSLHDAFTPGLAQEFARISALVPDCGIHLAGESGHPYGEEHPWMWTASDSFRQIADIFLARLTRPSSAA